MIDNKFLYRQYLELSDSELHTYIFQTCQTFHVTAEI